MGGALLALASDATVAKNFPAARIILGNATFIWVAFTGVSWVLEQTGAFRWLALQVARQPWEKGRSLFVLTLLATAAASALLTNCGAVLIAGPIALEILILLRLNLKATVAFAVACGLMADWASLPFTTSNLVNMIAASYAGISFVRYASVMLPVSVAAIATSTAVLLFYFWRYIPASYHRFDWSTPFTSLPPATASGDRTSPPSVSVVAPPDFSNFSFDVVGGGFYLSEAPDPSVPVSTRGSKRLQSPAWFKTLNAAPLQAILLTWGMYILAIALSNAGFTASLSSIFSQLAKCGLPLAILGSSLLAALQAGVMNNLAAAPIQSLAIQSASIADPAIREGMVYAVVIGCAIGAKISPIGSLCTLLWLGILERRGFHLSWSRYCHLSAILTLPIFLVTLLVLVIWLSVLI